MLTHSQIARRRARAWQLGAVVLLAAAGAAIALPVASLFAPSRGAGTAPATAHTPQNVNPAPPPGLTDLGRVLTDVGPRIVAAPPKPAPPADTALVAEAPAPAAPTGEWAYIGNIITPSARHAMVRIDQDQHVLRVGSGVGDTQVVAVEPSYLEVRTGEGPARRIDLAARTLLTPNDPPKVPINFRQPPMAGAGPGAMGASALARPGVAPGQFGASGFQGFGGLTPEQARLQQENAARAAASARHLEPPKRSGMHDEKGGAVSPEDREALLSDMKSALDPGADAGTRRDVLVRAGIKPGMDYGAAQERVREFGLDPDDPVVADAVKGVLTSPVSDDGDAKRREEEKQSGEKK